MALDGRLLPAPMALVSRLHGVSWVRPTLLMTSGMLNLFIGIFVCAATQASEGDCDSMS